MRTYFAYTRVSTVKQGERGSSLQEQKGAIEAYAVRHGLQIVAWFEEMETAAKLGRRQFNKMLSELERGRASGVVIHKIDRSARHLKDWAHLGELIDRGIEVHFAHESLDLASRGGRLSADIQAVVAADYIRNLRDEVRKGFYGRLKQGFYPLPAPLGYLDRGKAKAKEIDPVIGPLIREAFQLYANGRHTLFTLRDHLRARGVVGRTGRPISKASLAYLLRNPFYMGLIRIERTGETFDGVHRPLVSKALFDRVQAVMSGRVAFASTTHDFAFRRLIRCHRCGRWLVGERQKGKVYYRCHAQSCRGTSLSETYILSEACELLALLVLNNDELAELGVILRETDRSHVDDVALRRQHLRLSLGRCDDRLTRLTDAFLDGSIDKETFDHRKGALLAERRGIQNELEAPDPAPAGEAILEKLELGQTAYLSPDTPKPAEIRDAVISTSSNLVADGKYLGFTPHFPFDEIAKWRISHYGPPYRAEVRNGGALFLKPHSPERPRAPRRQPSIIQLEMRLGKATPEPRLAQSWSRTQAEGNAPTAEAA
jgi:DNA invertase Pin-like site-specific DNA recombinase